MKINDWHNDKIQRDAEYARAVELVELTDSIADIVVGMRVKAGISQTELARLAGTTQAAISRIECGEANPTIGTIERVLHALMNAGPKASVRIPPLANPISASPSPRHRFDAFDPIGPVPPFAMAGAA